MHEITRGMKKGYSEAELQEALKTLDISERDQRYILEHTEIAQLKYLNHQCCFLHDYLANTLEKHKTYDTLASFFNVNPRTIRRWIDNGPMDPKPLGRHDKLDDDIENQLIDFLRTKGSEGKGLRPNELLRYIYTNYKKDLTRGWAHTFLLRHFDELEKVKSFPLEDQQIFNTALDTHV